MSRKNTPPEPDSPMPQDGLRPEIAHAIMPDFPKWNRVFFQLDCVFALVNLLLTCVVISFFGWGRLFREPDLHVLVQLFLPTVLNVAVILAAWILRRRLAETDMLQNAIPVFTMLLLNLVVSMTPFSVFITLAVFCIPICMTTVYSSQRLCNAVSLISLGAVLALSARLILDAATQEERMMLLPQALIAVCILLSMWKVAQTAIKMTDGQKQKLIRFASDIRHEQRMAEAASEAKSLFLANMSHEIRTPINAILGMNEMILRETDSEQIMEYAQSIYSAGSSLLYLVNDVLDISKIESGKMELAENIYDLSSFIHDCYIMVAEKAEKKGLELTVTCDPQLPSRLKGDESRLRQVITNLLSNAAKYTETGRITLSFDGRGQDGQMMLVVTVKDTGIGIRQENIDKLFAQFARFDLEKNRNIEGTGLGLSLAKHLTDLMQGTLEVQSIYGVGTSATLTVPQQVVNPEPVGDFEEKYLSSLEKGKRYHQSFEAPDARILVVDDVISNLKVIINLLKSTRIKIDTAVNGRQCLEMVASTAYDLIFMDHMMPEMSGLDTFAEMRKLENSPNEHTPVVMLTANAITGIREQFLQAGFSDYLSKPVNGDKLEAMILKHLPRGKYRLENVEEDAGAEAGHPEVLQQLARLYPKVELSKGLSVCAGSYEVYTDILRTYAQYPETEHLDEFLKQEKAYDYQVCVHSVKSSSLNAGFSQLAAQALALENAARDENWDFIRANHPAFMDEYRQAIDAVEKVFHTKTC